MENKTTLQQFIEWGDKMLKEHPMKILSFAEAIDKAVELLDAEKQQIEDAYVMGSYDTTYQQFKPDQYFTETYENTK